MFAVRSTSAFLSSQYPYGPTAPLSEAVTQPGPVPILQVSTNNTFGIRVKYTAKGSGFKNGTVILTAFADDVL